MCFSLFWLLIFVTGFHYVVQLASNFQRSFSLSYPTASTGVSHKPGKSYFFNEDFSNPAKQAISPLNF